MAKLRQNPDLNNIYISRESEREREKSIIMRAPFNPIKERRKKPQLLGHANP